MESISNISETSSIQNTAETMGLSSSTDLPSMGTMMGTMMDNMCQMHHACKTGEINHLSIGMKAPDFSAKTTFGTMKMSDYKGKWLVFFSHPGDFTPVAKG